jgi:hypothetical protein
MSSGPSVAGRHPVCRDNGVTQGVEDCLRLPRPHISSSGNIRLAVAADAWDHSIRAIEYALIPIVVPTKDKANLGFVIAS